MITQYQQTYPGQPLPADLQSQYDVCVEKQRQLTTLTANYTQAELKYKEDYDLYQKSIQHQAYFHQMQQQ